MKTLFLSLPLYFFCLSLALAGNKDSTSSKYIILQNIIIEGNNRTKDAIILRECNLSIGDSIPFAKTFTVLTKNEHQIFNLGLFTDVTLTFDNWLNGNVDLKIIVQERWFSFPVPVLELADRNFNTWWQDQGKELSRVEYGIKFYHKNSRGRNETLKIKAQYGFTPKAELFYFIPYFNKAKTLGLDYEIHYSLNKIVPFQTRLNKRDFFEGNDFLKRRFRTSIRLKYRKGIRLTNSFKVTYYDNWIGDTIAQLNSDYFLNGNIRQQYFEFTYNLNYDARDVRYYPLKGHFLNIEFQQMGLGLLNNFSISALKTKYAHFTKIKSSNIYLANDVEIKVSTPTAQPYYNQRGVGYNQLFVRGYERYVIDGQHYFLQKNEIKLQLMNKNFSDFSLFKANQFNNIPIGIYAKAYFDWGYVSDRFFANSNLINNNMMLGGGLGLDFVSYYDAVLRVEFSMNRLLEKGLFLHFNISI